MKFILTIVKIFWFLDFMTDFPDLGQIWAISERSKNIRLLECKQIVSHFKARDLEIPNL